MLGYVYMNVMPVKLNEIRNIYQVKNSCYDTFHPNHICFVTCCASFGLAQRRFAESQETLNVS
jgi:hypothetical protein